MSARNRRAARKIAILVRMDSTRARMPTGLFLEVLGASGAVRYWESCMVPLGKKLSRMGLADRARAALESGRKKRIASGGRP
jgi:hypothetical protein